MTLDRTRGVEAQRMGTAMKFAASAPIILALCLVAQAGRAQGDEQIPYGSRAGMHLTTVSKQGIGTAHAVIRVKHTPKDAKAACVLYSQDYSMACVRATMAAVKVGDRVTANCVNRTWTDMYGHSYAFLGVAPPTDELKVVKYAVKDLKTGEILDGSSASGYPVELVIFQQLCPGIAK